jgi:hypothetical protein
MDNAGDVGDEKVQNELCGNIPCEYTTGSLSYCNGKVEVAFG